MTKWEYFKAVVSSGDDDVFAKVMNVYGQEGWEAVSTHRREDEDGDVLSYVVIFKRPAGETGVPVPAEYAHQRMR